MELKERQNSATVLRNAPIGGTRIRQSKDVLTVRLWVVVGSGRVLWQTRAVVR